MVPIIEADAQELGHEPYRRPNPRYPFHQWKRAGIDCAQALKAHNLKRIAGNIRNNTREVSEAPLEIQNPGLFPSPFTKTQELH